MRILVFNNEFPPLGGGTAIKNYNFFQVWKDNSEVTVDLITSSRTKSEYETEKFSDRITLHKVPVDNQNIHHASNAELLRYVRRAFKKGDELLRANRYDIAVCFHGVPAGAIAWRLSAKHPLPFVVILEGADIPGFETRYFWLYPFLKPLLSRIWKKAALVTAISKEHHALAMNFRPQMNIPIIHNGVDAVSFHPPENTRNDGVVRLICVGRLIERKGQHHLIKAFSMLENKKTELILVGTGDYEEKLKALAAECGVQDRVDFRGTVDLIDMPLVYREADIFVLPSMSEGMSLGLLEAMASGLPVIVTNAGGTDELVDENGLIVPWSDVPALHDAIAQLVDDKDARAKMSQRSRQTAERFSWDVVANKYLEEFERITNG